jgi:hypothetical protein
MGTNITEAAPPINILSTEKAFVLFTETINTSTASMEATPMYVV